MRPSLKVGAGPDVACTAGASVCFFISYRAEPTNCERNLSAPVVIMSVIV